MTYKQKLENQINFGKQKIRALDGSAYWRSIQEKQMWSGYVQGLRYAVATLSDTLTELPATNTVVQVEEFKLPEACMNDCLYPNCKCTCSSTDLQPFGECICGAGTGDVDGTSKVAPV